MLYAHPAARLELCKRTRRRTRKSGEELFAFVQDTLAVREPIYSRAHRICEIDHVDTPQKEQLFALELAKELAR